MPPNALRRIALAQGCLRPEPAQPVVPREAGVTQDQASAVQDKSATG